MIVLFDTIDPHPRAFRRFEDHCMLRVKSSNVSDVASEIVEIFCREIYLYHLVVILLSDGRQVLISSGQRQRKEIQRIPSAVCIARSQNSSAIRPPGSSQVHDSRSSNASPDQPRFHSLPYATSRDHIPPRTYLYAEDAPNWTYIQQVMPVLSTGSEAIAQR